MRRDGLGRKKAADGLVRCDPVQFGDERDLDQLHELVGVARHELHSVGQGRVAGLDLRSDLLPFGLELLPHVVECSGVTLNRGGTSLEQTLPGGSAQHVRREALVPGDILGAGHRRYGLARWRGRSAAGHVQIGSNRYHGPWISGTRMLGGTWILGRLDRRNFLRGVVAQDRQFDRPSIDFQVPGYLGIRVPEESGAAGAPGPRGGARAAARGRGGAALGACLSTRAGKPMSAPSYAELQRFLVRERRVSKQPGVRLRRDPPVPLHDTVAGRDVVPDEEFLEPSLPAGTAVQERSSCEFGGETWVFVDGPSVSGWVRDGNLLPVGGPDAAGAGADARRERAARDPVSVPAAQVTTAAPVHASTARDDNEE